MFVVMKFENAGLHFTKKSPSFLSKTLPSGKCLNFKFVNNKCVETIEDDGDDYSNPVPSHIVSNVLHVLCGEIPVPVKRDTNLVSDDRLDKIAKNSSYIKYDIKPKLNERGYPEISEAFSAYKACWNSHKQLKTEFKTVNGYYYADGAYNWDMIERGNPAKFPLFVSILSDFLDTDVSVMTFGSVIYEISKFWGNEEKMKELTDKLEENEFPKYFCDLFNGRKTELNTRCSGNTPILNRNGLSQITRFSGKIVCEINDEDIISMLKNNTGLAKILDGGVLYISKYEENSWEIPEFDEYEKVS